MRKPAFTKNPVYENWMTKSVGMFCCCNACDRIIFEGEKFYEGGYCEDCKNEIEANSYCETLKIIPTIL